MRMLVGIGVPSKYFTFPVVCVRQVGGGHVEPRQTADAADDEVGEDEHVPSAAQPEREAEDRRRDAERDDVGERVEVAAEDRLPPLVQARDVAVEDVEHERQRQQQERRPQEPAVVVGEVVQAQEDRDRPARGVADGEGVGRGVGPQHREVPAGAGHAGNAVSTIGAPLVMTIVSS